MAEKSTRSYHYGGQAVIEGVMMRGKEHFAVACRRANGEITATTEPIENSILGKLKWLNRPLLRGTLALVDSLFLGMKSLMWSGNLAMADETERISAEKSGETNDEPEKVSKKTDKANDVVLNVTLFISMAVAIGVFMFLPIVLTKWTLANATDSRVWQGLLEGGIKLAFLFIYIWGISRWDQIHRVFEYHGAEHKVINAYEAGEELTVENVQKHTTVHVRCGTSFLLVVILVSIVVFSAISWNSVIERLLYKLLLLPLVAGIAYEIIKFAGSRKDSKLMRLVLAPGLLMQRITTQEPADDQVEVAIKSFESVRDAEEEILALG